MGAGSISSMTDLFGAAAIEIRMDGQPIGKGRPRFSRKSGTVYTPEKTARYEERLAWAAQSVMRGRALLEGALTATVRFYVEIPASWSQKKQREALTGQLFPIKKPDIDNSIKLVFDALNKVVYHDDCQIISVVSVKRYSDRPRTEIVFIPTCQENLQHSLT